MKDQVTLSTRKDDLSCYILTYLSLLVFFEALTFKHTHTFPMKRMTGLKLYGYSHWRDNASAAHIYVCFCFYPYICC